MVLSWGAWRAPLMAGALLVAALARAGRAEACSCISFPVNELTVGDGRIPVNAGGIIWWFSHLPVNDSLESLVTVERVESAGRVPVPARIERFEEEVYLIRPLEGWSAGERYRVSVDAAPLKIAPGRRFRTVEVEITAPVESGELRLETSVRPQQRLEFVDFSGACSAIIEAAVLDLNADTPEGAPQQLYRILFFSTYVDGKLWLPSSELCSSSEPGASWTGRSLDRLVAACDGFESDVALSEGRHTVRMVARLPGSDVTFASAEEVVELNCGERSPELSLDELPEEPSSELRISDPGRSCLMSLAPGGSSAPVYGVALAALALALRVRR